MNSPAGRRLIVNADDFGLTEGTNRGIARAFERGIVTSASLMVRGEAAGDAARYAGRHPDLAVGLHFDLGEWAWDDGEWIPAYQVVDMDDANAVALELERQLDRFRTLMGQEPTHLDSHQHVHRAEPVRSIVGRAARMRAIPARDLTPEVAYRGDFYGQTGEGHPIPAALDPDRLADLLADLPAGTTELGCHPGLDPDLDSVYRLERLQEVEALTHPRVRASIEREGIELVSFAALGAGRRAITRPLAKQEVSR